MESIWQLLGEDFDSNLPRLTAVYVRESDGTVGFAYPSGENVPGYIFEHSIRTGYDMPPKFKLEFAAYERQGARLQKNRGLFPRQTTYPSLIRRELDYTNLPFSGTERFGRAVDGSLSWVFDLTCRTEWFRYERELLSVATSDELFSAERIGDVIALRFEDVVYYVAASMPTEFAVYRDLSDVKRELADGQDRSQAEGQLLALRHPVSLAPLERVRLAFGISTVSPEKARAAVSAVVDGTSDRALAQMEETIADDWDRWFASLPSVNLRCRQETRAYYKCWSVIRNNYYDHPAWGHCVLESLPVYKGLWQWAVPSVQWHSDQNSEHTSEWIEKALDLLFDSQREDGYVTHAVYIDEEVPGSQWAASGTVQTPHLAWTALRHCRATGNFEPLRRWARGLEKYYRFLCRTRDEELENLHLWAIFSSFDTGLDTTSVFQRVTYGEPGVEKEPYCYPSVFAAERYRYECSMAEIAELLGEDGEPWREAAARTREAMNRVLWDEARGWFGVRHADGTLDTRVGLDGLFALLYDVPDPSRIRAMERGVCSLIGPYGVRTVAEGEPGFRADVYWRGACWPKSCSVMMDVCRKYYPELRETVRDALLRMVLRYPNIWECWNVETGELAHSDRGVYCTPGMTSNVGAGDLIGSLWEADGFAMYDTDMALPLVPMKRFHHAGLRVTVEESGGRLIASAEPAERSEAEITFLTPEGKRTVALAAGRTVAF